MSEIVYSTQRVPNLGGRKIQNPVHFVRPEQGVRVVYVQEGYPHVASAYERAGAKVKPLAELPGQSSAPTAAPAEKKEK